MALFIIAGVRCTVNGYRCLSQCVVYKANNQSAITWCNITVSETTVEHKDWEQCAAHCPPGGPHVAPTKRPGLDSPTQPTFPISDRSSEASTGPVMAEVQDGNVPSTPTLDQQTSKSAEGRNFRRSFLIVFSPQNHYFLFYQIAFDLSGTSLAPRCWASTASCVKHTATIITNSLWNQRPHARNPNNGATQAKRVNCSNQERAFSSKFKTET